MKENRKKHNKVHCSELLTEMVTAIDTAYEMASNFPVYYKGKNIPNVVAIARDLADILDGARLVTTMLVEECGVGNQHEKCNRVDSSNIRYAYRLIDLIKKNK